MCFHIVWKLLQMSPFNLGIVYHFFVQFKSDLSGNTFFTASFIIGIFDLIVNLARFARIIETFSVMF